MPEQRRRRDRQHCQWRLCLGQLPIHRGKQFEFQ